MTTPSPSLPIDGADLTWLRRLAIALLEDRAEAEDLVQETVLAALESRSGPVESKRPWLASVARRLAARHRRGAIRREDREREAVPTPGPPAVDELAEAAESAELVARTARSLPEPYRRTVLEHFLAGRSVKEIARANAEKTDTVRWRLRRGLELMRAELERSSDGAPGRPGVWAVHLIPLAGLPVRVKVVGVSAAAAGLAPLALTSAALTMKGTLVAVALTLCVLGWLVGQRFAEPESPESPVASGSPKLAVDEVPGEAELQHPGAVAGLDVESRRAESGSAGIAPAEPARRWFRGRVVDGQGNGVEGAVLYLLEDGSGSEKGGPNGPTSESRRSGEFRFPAKELKRWLAGRAADVTLGVVANGFLRETVSGSLLLEPGLEIVLRRGESVEGRVVDSRGRGIEGLRLLVHGKFRGSTHVSPSRVLQRGSVRNLAGAQSSYHQSAASTGRSGEVNFTGLGLGAYTVRSLDPNWIIVEGQEVHAGDAGVRWVAEERFGVRVIGTFRGEGIDELEPELRDLVAAEFRAKFRVELELDDGTVIDTGQWLGAGAGVATFALMADADPRVDMSKVKAARFYGTASLGSEQKEWSAARQLRGHRREGVPEAAVDFEGTGGDRPVGVAGTALDATLELDVRYAGSGAPFTGPLNVAWTLRSGGGPSVTGDGRATPLPNGRYRAEVPTGAVELRVSDAQASGSLDPWLGRAACRAGVTEAVFVELTQGAAVTIERPDGTDGDWFVRASYRGSEGEEWFGSWNYGTSDRSLRLSALKPAQWRFELRAGAGDAEPMITHVSFLDEGSDLVVR